jgi:modification methylase
MGSGTTAVVAKNLGHEYIGIEISPEYCEYASERLDKETSIINQPINESLAL